MRTPLSYFLGITLAALTFTCLAAETTNTSPVIVISQFPDYPGPAGSRFPGGLIAVLWSDGRIIRPAGSNAVGRAYVQGIVSASERDKLFAFLKQSAVLSHPPADEKGIPIHRAFQIITLRRDGKQSKWKRFLPDGKTGFHEVEERLGAFRWKGNSQPTNNPLAVGCSMSKASRSSNTGASRFARGKNEHMDGAMHDLTEFIKPNTGWTFLTADTINDQGQIAGIGQIHGRRTHRLPTHAQKGCHAKASPLSEERDYVSVVISSRSEFRE
jgi:hypothetical protein